MNSGYSSGWCESSFGLPLVAVEILCRAKGDPCCRFIMAPPESIAQHVERYREGRSDCEPRKVIDGIPEFLARKRLEDELRRSEERLRRKNALLAGINRVFEEALKCDEDVGRMCLNVAEELTGSELGFIGEVTATGRLDTLAMSDPSWHACRIDESEAAVRIRDMEVRGLWGKVVRTGRPLLTNHPDSHPDSVGTPEGHPPITAFLGVPLKQGEQSFGLIALANKPSGYDVSDQKVAEALATAFVQALMRKRAEEMLREREERLTSIIRNASEVIYTLSPEGIITFASPACIEKLGREPPELEGRSFVPLVHPDDIEACLSYLREVLDTGQSQQGIEYRIQHKDGSWRRWYTSALSVIRDRDGNPLSLVGVGEDVTERKAAEEKLRSKEEELRQAQKLEAVGSLAGGIAHEFNNLLQAIGGYTRYAMEGLPHRDPRHSDLREVIKATERAATLTRQLLGFSRRGVLQPTDVEPNEAVADLAKLVRPLIGEHIHLETVFGGDVRTVRADPVELQQVLLNLSLNSRDAMPSGGKLFLRTELVELDEVSWEFGFHTKPGRYVAFVVADTGCGMLPEERERIFEPFFTTKGVGKGTGLGLAMVHGVVQQHGGAVHVETAPGNGTTFRVYLPSGSRPAPAVPADELRAAAHGTETILLAEDEPIVRRLAVRILERAGYTVLAASDGEEALRLFEENGAVVSLVILDVVMPRLSGHEVYRRIKKASPDLKVLFCTGHDPETAQSNLIAEEHLRLIEKPFEAGTLLAAVREALDEEVQCLLAAGVAG